MELEGEGKWGWDGDWSISVILLKEVIFVDRFGGFFGGN